jgi:hypothetical protein
MQSDSFYCRKPLATLSLVFVLLLSACGGQSEPGTGYQGGGVAPIAETTQPSSGGAQGAEACANPYYPAVQGASHVYAGTSSDVGAFSFTQTISEVRADGFTLTSQFDELTLSQEWSCGPDGIALLDYAGGGAAAIHTTGLQGTFTTTDMSGVTLPANVSAGSTWNQAFSLEAVLDMGEAGEASGTGSATIDYQAIGFEPVTVPAGTFDAMRVESTLSTNIEATFAGLTVPVMLTTHTVSWFVEGIGRVKAEETATFEGAEPMVTTIELQSYLIP